MKMDCVKNICYIITVLVVSTLYVAAQEDDDVTILECKDQIRKRYIETNSGKDNLNMLKNKLFLHYYEEYLFYYPENLITTNESIQDVNQWCTEYSTRYEITEIELMKTQCIEQIQGTYNTDNTGLSNYVLMKDKIFLKSYEDYLYADIKFNEIVYSDTENIDSENSDAENILIDNEISENNVFQDGDSWCNDYAVDTVKDRNTPPT